MQGNGGLGQVTSIELCEEGGSIEGNVGEGGGEGSGSCGSELAFRTHEELSDLTAGCESAFDLFNFTGQGSSAAMAATPSPGVARGSSGSRYLAGGSATTRLVDLEARDGSKASPLSSGHAPLSNPFAG